MGHCCCLPRQNCGVAHFGGGGCFCICFIVFEDVAFWKFAGHKSCKGETSGWIIFTGSLSLIDGSTMRMPGTKITDHEGKNMELNPRRVDVFVSKSLGHSGKDEQLDTAVKELLGQVDKK